MAIDRTKVKYYIEQNLRTINTVGDVAQAMNVSIETLRKEFLRTERTSIGKFIKETRIEKAKKLLTTTTFRCFEICFETGFKREDTGARVFRKVTGTTMEEFRANHSNDKSKVSIPKLPTRKANH